MPKAMDAASRAIALLDRLPSPFATTACVKAVYDWDWADAERRFHHAIDLNPAHPAAHHWYAINCLVPLGRFADAESELRHAIEADPLSMPIHVSLGILSYFARRYSEAAKQLRDSLELEGGSVHGRLFLGLALVEMGATEKATRELETAAELSRTPETVAALGYAMARAGNQDRARTLLGELAAMSDVRYVSPSLRAQVHAALGETSRALDCLDKAADLRAADLAWIGVRPVFDSLRGEQRLAALTADVGLTT
jgi:serine/threonine-protein kinase